MKISHLDHLVLTVANIDKSVKFYTEILGFELIIFGTNRKALKFGSQKINLHEKGAEIAPYAFKPTCGSADLCFVTDDKIDEIYNELLAKNVKLESGIVKRTGTLGEILSIYLRDPDQNLIEISAYA